MVKIASSKAGLQKRSSNTLPQKLTAVWNSSKTVSTKIKHGVETPLIKAKKNIRLYNFDSAPTSTSINDRRFNNSMMRLLSIHNGKDFKHLILTYVPDNDFINGRRNRINEISINNLKNFSGYIEYANIDEEVIFVAHFKEGLLKRKYFVSFSEAELLQKNSFERITKQAKSSTADVQPVTAYNTNQNCGWQLVPIYGVLCITGGDPPIEYCGDAIVGYQEIFIPCDPEPPEPDFCDLPENFYICEENGGGGSNPNPTPTPGSPDSIKIDVDPSLLDKIDTELEYIEDEEGYCVYKELLKRVLENGGTINISDKVEELQQPITLPVYNRSTSTIYINADYDYAISASLLSHEIFHVFQDKNIYKTNMANYSKGQKGYTNIEFERVIFEDIRRAMSDKNRIGNQHFSSNTTTEEGRKAYENYKEWILELTSNGTETPILQDRTSFDTEFKEHLRKFDIYGTEGYRQGGRDELLTPKALKELFKNNINCNN